MKLLYGTNNQAKLESMKRVTNQLGIEIFGFSDLRNMPDFKNVKLPDIEETGKNPLENAIIKAKEYYKILRIPLFSCDSGLYFENVDEDLQPGTYVRRVRGKELSDVQMVEYYGNLAKNHGGKLVAKYKNAICLILGENQMFTRMDESIEIGPFYMVDKPHEKIVPGFPLDALSVDIETGKYFQDMDENLAVDKSVIEQGFTKFFEEVLGKI